VGLIEGNCILVGISPFLSMQMTNSNVDMKDIMFFSTLEHGVQYALEQSGFDICEKVKK
jgi:rsbT co-antagonist protein RsbR